MQNKRFDDIFNFKNNLFLMKGMLLQIVEKKML